jgi:hypothetical protein
MLSEYISVVTLLSRIYLKRSFKSTEIVHTKRLKSILVQAELKILYDKFPHAPKSYWAFRRVMVDE